MHVCCLPCLPHSLWPQSNHSRAAANTTCTPQVTTPQCPSNAVQHPQHRNVFHENYHIKKKSHTFASVVLLSNNNNNSKSSSSSSSSNNNLPLS